MRGPLRIRNRKPYEHTHSYVTPSKMPLPPSPPLPPPSQGPPPSPRPRRRWWWWGSTDGALRGHLGPQREPRGRRPLRRVTPSPHRPMLGAPAFAFNLWLQSKRWCQDPVARSLSDTLTHLTRVVPPPVKFSGGRVSASPQVRRIRGAAAGPGRTIAPPHRSAMVGLQRKLPTGLRFTGGGGGHHRNSDGNAPTRQPTICPPAPKG